jgi:tetraacyldisaccharide 4'-kinase
VPSGPPALRLQALWYSAARPPWPLRLLAALFGAALRGRAVMQRMGWPAVVPLPRPVVVVGNLTVGGTGKTPLVAWLCGQLRAAGWRPGVILRGFGGSALRSGIPLRVEPQSDPALVGDEAVLLRARTGAPVAVCPDRVRAARSLIGVGVDVLIADDGLQHVRLPRCFEIVVVDGARAFGNGYLLPAGPLREPVARLARCDALVLQGSGAALPPAPSARAGRFAMQLRGDVLRPVEEAGRGQDGERGVALATLAGRRVHAIAGIGNPQRFFAQLRAAGLEPIEHPYPDHARLQPADLEFADGLPVLMTEKDAVKCRTFGGADRWYLPVTAHFSEADTRALMTALERALAAFGGHGMRE